MYVFISLFITTLVGIPYNCLKKTHIYLVNVQLFHDNDNYKLVLHIYPMICLQDAEDLEKSWLLLADIYIQVS